MLVHANANWLLLGWSPWQRAICNSGFPSHGIWVSAPSLINSWTQSKRPNEAQHMWPPESSLESKQLYKHSKNKMLQFSYLCSWHMRVPDQWLKPRLNKITIEYGQMQRSCSIVVQFIHIMDEHGRRQILQKSTESSKHLWKTVY